MIASTPPAPSSRNNNDLNDGRNVEDDFHHPDVAIFADHMDELHIHRAAVAASTNDGDYNNFFEHVANIITPFHEEMHFNSKHTDEEESGVCEAQSSKNASTSIQQASLQP
ncbi:hypothetical protein ONS96_006830 [Cadophora gregata f. sp. sojae]|nr:hypothetical protein ONS96_006830 [Cadophora gregata f. sp. sojae]